MRVFVLTLMAMVAWLPANAKLQIPALSGPVVDQVGLLSSSANQAIVSELRAFHQRGHGQIQVLIVDSLQGLAIEEYSIAVVEQWKLGSAKQDNGALLLIAPHERQMRIEVGQGFEGQLPDVVASRIIREAMTPLFRQGQLDQGVLAGVQAIISRLSPENSSGLAVAPVQTSSFGRLLRMPFEVIMFLLLSGFFLLRAIVCFFRRLIGFPCRPIGAGAWGRNAMSGGLLSGGSGWSGGGGGGWSGGGGGFSGGGASGSW